MKRYLIVLIIYTLFLDAKTFNKIEFQGDVDLITGEFDRETLLKICHIEYPPIYKIWKKDPVFESEQIEGFVERLTTYTHSMGYYEAIINAKTKDDKIILDITKNRAIKVNSISMDEQCRRFALFKKGKRFRTTDFTQTKKDIVRQLEETGYPAYTMDAKAFVNLDLYQVDINISIKKGEKYYFSHTDMNNSSDINNELITEQITYKDGEVYNIEKVEDSYDNLYRLGVFSTIDVYADLNISSVKIPVSIYLEEGKSKEFASYIGYDTQDGVKGGVQYIDHSFLGDLRDFKVEVEVTELWHSVDTTIYDPKVQLPILGKFNFKNEMGYENFDFGFFGYETIIERATFGKKILGLEHFFGFQLEYSDVKVDDDIALALAELLAETNYLINSLFYKLVIDKRDSKMDAKNGYYASLYIEKAIRELDSDMDYLKLLVEARYIKEVAPFVFAIKLEAGALSQKTPLFKHFYGGGAMSNRGYEYRDLGVHIGGEPIGGVGIIDTSIEVRRYLSEKFALVGFIDASTISQEVKKFNSDWYRSYGMGVRYSSLIGPLRFDIGLQEDGDFAIHLGIGQVF
jgi:translocation and assembly module TamA